MGCFRRSALALALSASTLSCTAATPETYESEKADYRLDIVAQGLQNPWGMVFLPNGDKLVTERPGRLRLIRGEALQEEPVEGLPELKAGGQGGLLDIILDPDFKDNRQLYISYSHENSDGLTTRVARAVYQDNRLSDVEVIFDAEPRSGQAKHFAGRMVIDQEGRLYVPVGDRGDMDRAQDLHDDAGGVHRINTDGSTPGDNPWAEDDQGSDTKFTTGNRNIQGMFVHPDTGEIWSQEHGPRGGDEVNIIEAGLNYGWPEITYGINYSGTEITDQTEKAGMEQPLHYWDPSIAPSGMALYTGDAFPDWQGDVFVGALKDQMLVRLTFNDEHELTHEEHLMKDFGERIREVENGPDGVLWVLTDERNGKVVRIVPAD